MKKSLAPNRRRRLHFRCHQSRRAVYKINAGERMINFEWPRAACFGANVIPIVQPNRHIAVPLNLEHHDAVSERGIRSSRQEDAIAGLRSEVCEIALYGPIRERPP